MTIQYGLTIDNQNFIIEKAKTKKDGIYTIRGVAYKVVNNMVEFFAAGGEVIQICYGFNVVIGSYDHLNIWSDTAKGALKKIVTVN